MKLSLHCIWLVEYVIFVFVARVCRPFVCLFACLFVCLLASLLTKFLGYDKPIILGRLAHQIGKKLRVQLAQPANFKPEAS